MHQKYGFEKCGVYHKTGYTHGRWLDVGVYEKNLLPYDDPSPVISIQNLNRIQLEKMLSAYQK